MRENGLLLATPSTRHHLSIPVVCHPADLGLRLTDVLVLALASQETEPALDAWSEMPPHTEPTLVNDYLVRSRGAITDYQRVVADVLTREVSKARTHAALRTLTQAEVEGARTDPKAAAARHGLDAATLQRLLSGELDTVMAGCADHTNSPHAPTGQPCRAICRCRSRFATRSRSNGTR
jgi:hypothetical protein